VVAALQPPLQEQDAVGAVDEDHPGGVAEDRLPLHQLK